MSFAVNADRCEFVDTGMDGGTVPMDSEPVSADSDRHAIGFTTSAGYGHSVGTSHAYAWLPAEFAEKSTTLSVSCFTSDSR